MLNEKKNSIDDADDTDSWTHATVDVRHDDSGATRQSGSTHKDRDLDEKGWESIDADEDELEIEGTLGGNASDGSRATSSDGVVEQPAQSTQPKKSPKVHRTHRPYGYHRTVPPTSHDSSANVDSRSATGASRSSGRNKRKAVYVRARSQLSYATRWVQWYACWIQIVATDSTRYVSRKANKQIEMTPPTSRQDRHSREKRRAGGTAPLESSAHVVNDVASGTSVDNKADAIEETGLGVTAAFVNDGGNKIGDNHSTAAGASCDDDDDDAAANTTDAGSEADFNRNGSRMAEWKRKNMERSRLTAGIVASAVDYHGRQTSRKVRSWNQKHEPWKKVKEYTRKLSSKTKKSLHAVTVY